MSATSKNFGFKVCILVLPRLGGLQSLRLYIARCGQGSIARKAYSEQISPSGGESLS